MPDLTDLCPVFPFAHHIPVCSAHLPGSTNWCGHPHPPHCDHHWLVDVLVKAPVSTRPQGWSPLSSQSNLGLESMKKWQKGFFPASGCFWAQHKVLCKYSVFSFYPLSSSGPQIRLSIVIRDRRHAPPSPSLSPINHLAVQLLPLLSICPTPCKSPVGVIVM